MIKSKLHFYVRRAHRYLGVFLGIQFLAWTVGGLYFSWTNIDDIHGDPQRRETPLLSLSDEMVAPNVVFEHLKQDFKADSLVSMQLIGILDTPYYQVVFTQNKVKKTQLAYAKTGILRPPLSEKEAVVLAKSRFKDNAEVKNVAYLESTDGHHEYREKPLPAYAITFEHPTNTTVYIAAELGTVQSFRNNQWRIFDFLWMLHTMDFKERDNINNWLLRAFSVLGLVTLSSGFLLFFVSFKRKINNSMW